MKSTLFSANTKDVLRGLIIAVLTPVFVIIQQSITAGSLVFDWKSIAIAAIGGFLAYLTKNFFTDSTAAAVKTLEKQNVEIVEKPQPINK